MCRSGRLQQSTAAAAAAAQHRGMRRFARRRRTLAAFTAIMGRFGRAAAHTSSSFANNHHTAAAGGGGGGGGGTMRAAFKVHYRKLVEEPSPTKKQRRNDDVEHSDHQAKSAKNSSSQLQQQQQQVVQMPDYMSYCCCRCGHTQKLKAEELNTIVGNAFRMAYVAQLQRQPILHDVISSKSTAHFRKDKQQQQQQQQDNNRSVWNKSLSDTANNNNNNTNNNNNNNCSSSSSSVLAVGNKSKASSSSVSSSSNTTTTTTTGSSGSNSGGDDDDACSSAASPTGDMNLSASCSPTLRLSSVKTPNSIPGLRPSHNFGALDGCNDAAQQQQQSSQKSCSQQSTPSSDESNSPTELNSYKRLTDKPPLIKRLAMGLAGGRDVLGLNVAGEEDSCPLVSGGSTPTSPTSPTSPKSPTTTRPHSGGYINEAIIDSEPTTTSSTITRSTHYGKLLPATESLDNTINSSINAKNFSIENNRLAQSSTEADFKSKRRSQLSSSSSSAAPADGSTLGSTPTPPPLPERHDSLSFRNEESELRRAPWFQAGIPREITLEVLSQEPEGAFMVRESTSKPGCYALSLRVPRDFQPSGIAHYLIMRIAKGYKIKGFTKEFTTLTSLITHHSVMPELLPCPLSLSRYNPSFVKAESSKDFADIDSDPDYNTLADFRKMMADLNV